MGIEPMMRVLHRYYMADGDESPDILFFYFAKDRRCLGYPGFSGRQNGILRTGSTVRYPGTGSRVPTGTHIYTKFICTRT